MATTIKEYSEGRGIKSLVHFTRLSNIPSIFKHGLLTREACKSQRVKAITNDAQRLDCTNGICFTITFPNYRMFYRMRKENPGVEWAVVAVDRSVLWRLDCVFCQENAARNVVTAIPIEDRKGLGALKRMFADHDSKSRAELKIPKHYATHPQAEVLVLENIPPNLILGAAFSKLITQQEYKKQYPKLTFFHDGGFFGPRADFNHWKS